MREKGNHFQILLFLAQQDKKSQSQEGLNINFLVPFPCFASKASCNEKHGQCNETND